MHAVLKKVREKQGEFTGCRVFLLMLNNQEVKSRLTTSSSSTSTMSYALRAPQKMMQVTPSKQWIHFFLSDLWPPTSNILFTTERVTTKSVLDVAVLCGSVSFCYNETFVW